MGYEDFKYSSYLVNNQETRWATTDEIKNSGAYVNLAHDDLPAGGLPLISNGKELYVDDKDTHTMIFGATGSKKTRLFCMPMINLFAKAGESFVVTDPKGELFAKTSGYVTSKGYKPIVLNFRNVGYGDFWNPLSLPYTLYHSGEKEKAISMLNDFVSAVAAPYEQDYVNRFFNQMAKAYILAVLLLMAECGSEEQMNVGNLARLCTSENIKYFRELSNHMLPSSVAGINFKGVFNSGEKTMNSILASVYSMINEFNVHQDIINMISNNSVTLSNIGREKTAVYLIIPDEKTTSHFLANSFVKQAYEVLISEAQKEQNFGLPIRVNFILDEFCNMPRIADMPAMITAARSRNMRFFLVAQSLHQLKGKYGEDANTIKGNCDNWVFLSSKEQELLDEISNLCGQIRLPNGITRRLISTSELQRLRKEKGETLILHGREYPFITEIADIDQYECFKGYHALTLEKNEITESTPFSMDEYHKNVLDGKIPYPFSNGKMHEKPPVSALGSSSLEDLLGIQRSNDRTKRFIDNAIKKQKNSDEFFF